MKKDSKKYYQVKINITGLLSFIEQNKTREEILNDYLCPFIGKETTILDGSVFNLSSLGSLRIFTLDKPIDSKWPLDKDSKDFIESYGENKFDSYKYDSELQKYLQENGDDITEELFEEAIVMMSSDNYKEKRKIITSSFSKESFYICPFDNVEINQIYELIIKPATLNSGYSIKKIDENPSNNLVIEEIKKSINKSQFIIADLTEERPNCYFEAGYADAIGKRIIFMAKKGTKLHFDIAGRQVIFWEDLEPKNLLTLKEKLEASLTTILD